MNRLCCLVIAAWLPCSGALLANETPRVAVFGEGDAAEFADVLSVQLSSLASCSLVERSEMERLATEASLQQLASTERPVALARLAKADGLLIAARDNSDPAHPLLVLRLIATDDGSLVHGQALAWLPKDLASCAKYAVQSFRNSFSGLGRVGSRSATTISLLGIRADLDSPTMRSWENSLNTVLAHRLSAQPGLRVAERWRLNDVVFERAISPLKATALATGALLIDGTFHVVGDAVTLTVRSRKAGADAGQRFELTGSLTERDALVEKMVRIVIQQVGSDKPPAPWSPAVEAREYEELGWWLLSQRLAPQAVQALEAAIALGDTAREAAIARVMAYAACAGSGILSKTITWRDYPDNPPPTSTDFPLKLQSATRALDLAYELLHSGTFPMPDSDGIVREGPMLGISALKCALSVLRAVQQVQLHAKYLTEVTTLRESVRRMVAAIDLSPRKDYRPYLLLKICHAAYICSSPEQTLQVYKAALATTPYPATPDPNVRPWDLELRECLASLESGMHGPVLGRLNAPAQTVPPSFLPVPAGPILRVTYLHGRENPGAQRLIDWTKADQSEVTRLWNDYVQSLQASPSMVEKADGLSFEFHSLRSGEARLRMLNRFLDMLEEHRAELTTHEGLCLRRSLDISFVNLGASATREAGPTWLRTLRLLTDLFAKEQWLPQDWFSALFWVGELNIKALVPETEMRALLEAVVSYQARASRDRRWTTEVAKTFDWELGRLRILWQRIQSTPKPTTVSFRAAAFWTPHGTPLVSLAPRGLVIRRALAPDHDHIWVPTSSGLIRLQTLTRQSEWMGGPPSTERTAFTTVAADQDSVWLGSSETVWKVDRTSHHWTKSELPKAKYQVRTINGDCFVSFGKHDMPRGTGAEGESVGKLTANGVQWMMATRRRPSMNPLDNLRVAELLGCAPGPRGAAWVLINGFSTATGPIVSFFDLAAKDSATPTLRLDNLSPTIVPDGQRTLVWAQPRFVQSVAQVWLLDPAKSAPEPLLLETAPAQGQTRPRWAYPDTFRADAGRVKVSYMPVMHGNEMWVVRLEIRREDMWRSHMDLFAFTPDRSTAVRIPVALSLSEEEIGRLPGKRERRAEVDAELGQPDIHNGQVAANDHHLAISCSQFDGIWLLAWEELREWIKAHPSSP